MIKFLAKRFILPASLETRLKLNTKWTIRTCLLRKDPDRHEYGLKREIGIKSEEVLKRLLYLKNYYKNMGESPVFVVYPYFEAKKSGIIELHAQEVLIEAVSGPQWRLTEEAAPIERWLYTGIRDQVTASKFKRILAQDGILTQNELNKLSNHMKKIPHDDVLLEWSFTVNEELLFYDLRKVPTLTQNSLPAPPKSPYLQGLGASPGRVRGKIKVIREISKIKPKAGEILVVKEPTKDLSTLIPILPSNTGIITERGGITSHAALICREFKIPLIVNLEKATHLKDGWVVTLDGHSGRVYLEGFD